MLFSSKVTVSSRVMNRFSVWLVGGYAHVFVPIISELSAVRVSK